MVVPCLLVFLLVFFERGTYGGIDWGAATLENIARTFDPLYFSIFLDSGRIALLATIIALLIGYPAAYAIAKAPETRKGEERVRMGKLLIRGPLHELCPSTRRCRLLQCRQSGDIGGITEGGA